MISPHAGAGSPPQIPSYLHHHSRPHSKANLVLVHGYWGQGNIFLPLVPLLNDRFDATLIHDPFFGKSDGPTTITEWADYYLRDIGGSIRHDLPVILGGYSLGGLIAFEMASRWRNAFGSNPGSLLLLDAGSYPSTAKFLSQETLTEGEVERGLDVFGHDQQTLVRQHFARIRPLSLHPVDQHVYEGDCLYLVTLETTSADWWADHCPKRQMRLLHCGHFDVFHHSMVGTVAQLKYMSTIVRLSKGM